MKSFKQHITEKRQAFVKGWTLKSKIVSVSTDYSNYHIMQVTNKPSKFGLNEKKLLKILEDWYEDMSAPDHEREARIMLRKLQSGSEIDNSPPIEDYLMKKGYCRFVIDKAHGSVEGQTEKECRESAKLLDDNYLPFEADGFKLFEIKPVRGKPNYITNKLDWYDWTEGKAKRKYVSKMAQFREMKSFTEFLLEVTPTTTGWAFASTSIALSTASNPIVPISSKATTRKGTGLGFDNVPPDVAKELLNHPDARPGDSLLHIINRIAAKEIYKKTKETAQKWGTDIENAPNMISPADSYREAVMKFSEYQQATLEMLDKHRQEILFRIWDPAGKFRSGLLDPDEDDTQGPEWTPDTTIPLPDPSNPWYNRTPGDDRQEVENPYFDWESPLWDGHPNYIPPADMPEVPSQWPWEQDQDGDGIPDMHDRWPNHPSDPTNPDWHWRPEWDEYWDYDNSPGWKPGLDWDDTYL